jgi:hypothetical protein
MCSLDQTATDPTCCWVVRSSSFCKGKKFGPGTVPQMLAYGYVFDDSC